MTASDLPQLVRAYVTERRRSGDLAEATVPNVRWVLLNFCEAVGPIRPGQLRAEHIQAWMAASKVARSTNRNRFSIVRGFCRWLILHGHLRADPTLHLKAPKQPRPVPRGLPADDVRALVRTLPDSRARFIVVWMVQLGLRAVELARLEVGDIDLEQRTVLLRGKGGWQRLLPITEEAWAVLVAYLVECPPRAAGPVLRSCNDPWKGLHEPITTPHAAEIVAAFIWPSLGRAA
jgi:site-specific recombinase XerC